MGQYEGSGFKDPPFIVRRADGQTLQLSELLFLIASRVDGGKSYEEIAQDVSQAYGKSVSGANVEQLIDERLRPLGVLLGADGSEPKVKRAPSPLLALKHRVALVPEGAVRVIATIFKPLFWPVVVAAILAAFLAMDYWIFFVNGIGQSIRNTLYEPLWVVVTLGLVIVSAAFHELGHASACAYGGGKPGALGAGLYIIYPAFYSDVTDAYRLDRAGRIRTDLGGIYFNLIFSLATFGVYLTTGYEQLLAVIVIQHLEIVHQLLPFLRLDGYYVIADLTGVPDLFARIKPTLKSMVPGQDASKKVEELKPWARAVVTVWVLLAVPLLLYVFAMLVLATPRIFATAWDSLGQQWDKVRSAFGDGEAVTGVAGSLQMAAVALPVGGITMMFGRTGKRIATGMWRFTDQRPVSRIVLGGLGVAAVVIAAFVLWPNGDYKPLHPDESWTVQETSAAFSDIESGRPSLTPEREQELSGATGEDSSATQDSDESGTEGSTGDDSTEETTEAEPTSSPSPTPTPTTSPTS